MDYEKIYNKIIKRAFYRSVASIIYHKHHVFPKCEGGVSDDIVLLSLKEHRIVHLLRYKITKDIGNLHAYNLLKNGILSNRLLVEYGKRGARYYHTLYKLLNYDEYIMNQTLSGRKGGQKCHINKLGMFSLSVEEMCLARDKGRTTMVENKIGMFSDAYRKEHAKKLMKSIFTPDGVFDSMMDAANYYGVSNSTITYRIKKFNGWGYLRDEFIG